MGCNNSKGADTSAFSQPTTNLDDEEEAGLEHELEPGVRVVVREDHRCADLQC